MSSNRSGSTSIMPHCPSPSTRTGRHRLGRPRRLSRRSGAPSSDVADAGGLNDAGVDGRLLVVTADITKIGEQVRTFSDDLGVESSLQAAHDVPAGMQPLIAHTPVEVPVPAQAGRPPAVSVVRQPAVLAGGEPVAAPAGSRLV